MKTVSMIMGALAAAALFTAAAHAQEPSHVRHVAKYEGTASCVSAACHEGTAKEVAESSTTSRWEFRSSSRGGNPASLRGCC